MAEMFGCCSNYVKCSDKGECLFLDNKDYEGCYYRRNLEQNKNFYSTKTFVKSKYFQKNKKMFIACYELNLKVSRRSRNGSSYALNNEEYETLHTFFTDKSIPFVTSLDNSKCIVEGNTQEPANSRVLFSVGDTTFVIGSFNQCLILKRYADGILKSLKQNGIDAWVELSGSYAYKTDYQKINNDTKKDLKIISPKIEIKKEPKILECKQMSIFDLMGA